MQQCFFVYNVCAAFILLIKLQLLALMFLVTENNVLIYHSVSPLDIFAIFQYYLLCLVIFSGEAKIFKNGLRFHLYFHFAGIQIYLLLLLVQKT